MTGIDLSLMITIAVRTTIILVLGLLAVRMLRKASPKLRYEAVVMTMAACLAIPLLHVALPALNIVPVPQQVSETPIWSALTGGDITELGESSHSSVLPTQQTGSTKLDTRSESGVPVIEQEEAGGAASNGMVEAMGYLFNGFRSLSIIELAALLWAFGAMMVGMRAIHSRWSLRRLWKASRSVDTNHWSDLLEEAGDRVFLTREFETREVAGIRSPMTWGIQAPKLLLPLEAREWSSERKLNAIMHELVHIRRRDAVHDVVASVVVAANWFNPLAWSMRTELKAQRETSCDSEVLALGAQPEEYARMLIDVAKEMRQHRPAPQFAMTIARPSQLEGRVLSVLNYKGESGKPYSRWGLVASVTFAALFTAAAAPTPASLLDPTATASSDGATVDDAEINTEQWQKPQKESGEDLAVKTPATPNIEVQTPGPFALPQPDVDIPESRLDLDQEMAPGITMEDISRVDNESLGDILAVAGIRLADTVLNELAYTVEEIDWSEVLGEATWDIEGDGWSFENRDGALDDGEEIQLDTAVSRFAGKMQDAIAVELEKVIRENKGTDKARRALTALLEMDTDASVSALDRLGYRPIQKQ